MVTKIWGNPSSLHKLGDRAHGLLEASRKQVADLLGVNTDEITLLPAWDGTNNTAIKGTAWAKREFGKHIITSSVEHASVANTFTELKTWVSGLPACR